MTQGKTLGTNTWSRYSLDPILRPLGKKTEFVFFPLEVMSTKTISWDRCFDLGMALMWSGISSTLALISYLSVWLVDTWSVEKYSSFVRGLLVIFLQNPKDSLIFFLPGSLQAVHEKKF